MTIKPHFVRIYAENGSIPYAAPQKTDGWETLSDAVFPRFPDHPPNTPDHSAKAEKEAITLELDYIREFVTLAETGSFQEAADLLFVAQSSLSRHIKTLEESLDVSLFDRTTRKVSLNRYGKLLLPYAKEMLRIQYDMTTAFANERHEIQGTVTVGSIPMMKPYHITDVIAQFQKENKSYNIDIIEADSIQLIEMLRGEKCDFAFIRETDDSDNEFNKLAFAEDRLSLVVHRSHPLASRQTVSIAQLRDEPLLLIGKDSTMYKLCIRICHAAGFEPRIVFTGRRADNIIDLVSKEMGVALLMETPASSLINDSVRMLQVNPTVTTKISLAYHKTHKMNSAAMHFLDLVKSL